MKLYVLGRGPVADQALRLAAASGREAAAGTALPETDALILPATDDEALLSALSGRRCLFDADAWQICASRLRADALLAEKGVAVPAYFPGGSEPYIVKPDRGGFGMGIWVTDDYCEVGGAVNAGFVTQEELPGDVWSTVVLGRPGAYRVLPPARLCFDGRRRTGAECLPAPKETELCHTALSAAEAVGVRGILEVEAMDDHGRWKVIDLNARLPVFTPDALLAAHGVNVLEEMIDLF